MAATANDKRMEMAQRRLEAIRRKSDLPQEVTFFGLPLSAFSREELEVMLAECVRKQDRAIGI